MDYGEGRKKGWRGRERRKHDKQEDSLRTSRVERLKIDTYDVPAPVPKEYRMSKEGISREREEQHCLVPFQVEQIRGETDPSFPPPTGRD